MDVCLEWPRRRFLDVDTVVCSVHIALLYMKSWQPDVNGVHVSKNYSHESDVIARNRMSTVNTTLFCSLNYYLSYQKTMLPFMMLATRHPHVALCL